MVATQGAVAASVLDGPPGRQDWLALAELAVAHAAASVRLSRRAPIDYARFAAWFSLLVHRHGARLLRAKAVLDVAGSDTPVALHAVQHLIHPPEHLGAWTGPRETNLVLVTDGLNAASLIASFDAFLPPPTSRQAA